MEFEKYKYFTWFFHRLKYLMCCFEASVQLVPKSYSHLSCGRLELQLILQQIGLLNLAMFNWSPNIYQKWNWAKKNLQILCLKLLNLKKMGAKVEKSLLELLLKDSHIVQWSQRWTWCHDVMNQIYLNVLIFSKIVGGVVFCMYAPRNWWQKYKTLIHFVFVFIIVCVFVIVFRLCICDCKHCWQCLSVTEGQL